MSNKEICVLCNQKATKNAIHCDRCNKWEHKACANVSDNIYAEINDVPMNIRFFCTPCCSVISSILEMHVALDSVTSSITAKLGNLAKSLDDVSNKLSHQLQEIEAKLSTTDNFEEKSSKFLKNIDAQLSDQLRNMGSKFQATDADKQLSHQLQEIKSKLLEPNTAFKKQLKALENVSKQACSTSVDTASKIVGEYRDMERRQWNLMF